MIPLFCDLDFLAEVAAVVPKVITVINQGQLFNYLSVILDYFNTKYLCARIS